jgi:hypothetical protein
MFWFWVWFGNLQTLHKKPNKTCSKNSTCILFMPRTIGYGNRQ